MSRGGGGGDRQTGSVPNAAPGSGQGLGQMGDFLGPFLDLDVPLGLSLPSPPPSWAAPPLAPLAGWQLVLRDSGLMKTEERGHRTRSFRTQNGRWWWSGIGCRTVPTWPDGNSAILQTECKRGSCGWFKPQRVVQPPPAGVATTPMPTWLPVAHSSQHHNSTQWRWTYGNKSHTDVVSYWDWSTGKARPQHQRRPPRQWTVCSGQVALELVSRKIVSSVKSFVCLRWPVEAHWQKWV